MSMSMQRFRDSEEVEFVLEEIPEVVHWVARAYLRGVLFCGCKLESTAALRYNAGFSVVIV